MNYEFIQIWIIVRPTSKLYMSIRVGKMPRFLVFSSNFTS